MNSKPIKVPGPDHPITIEPCAARVRVLAAGVTVADSRHAFVMREADYSPVYYLPAVDVHLSQLAESAHTTYCPYKGDCSYYDIPAGGARSIDAVWCYRKPYPAVAAIADHLAFYPEGVDAIEVEPEPLP